MVNNQLMERLVLGGFNYDVAFPFFGVAERRREKLLEELARSLKTKALDIATMILDNKDLDYYLKAVEVAEKRFLFYKNLLESEELKNKHLTKLGIEDLTLRIVFAMHGCIVHANKILCHMDNLISDMVPDSLLAMKIGYHSWSVLNIKEPTTTCQMTGVCICKQGDAEPYIDGCVMSDPTKIMISKGESEKILADDIEIRVARRLEKNNK